MPDDELEDTEVMALIRKHNETCPECKKLFDQILLHVGKQMDIENNQTIKNQEVSLQSNM